MILIKRAKHMIIQIQGHTLQFSQASIKWEIYQNSIYSISKSYSLSTTEVTGKQLSVVQCVPTPACFQANLPDQRSNCTNTEASIEITKITNIAMCFWIQCFFNILDKKDSKSMCYIMVAVSSSCTMTIICPHAYLLGTYICVYADIHLYATVYMPWHGYLLYIHTCISMDACACI